MPCHHQPRPCSKTHAHTHASNPLYSSFAAMLPHNMYHVFCMPSHTRLTLSSQVNSLNHISATCGTSQALCHPMCRHTSFNLCCCEATDASCCDLSPLPPQQCCARMETSTCVAHLSAGRGTHAAASVTMPSKANTFFHLFLKPIREARNCVL